MQELIRNINNELVATVKSQSIIDLEINHKFPSMAMVSDFIFDVQRLMFPGFFGRENMEVVPFESFTADRLGNIYDKLFDLVKRAYAVAGKVDKNNDEEIKLNVQHIIEKIPKVYKDILLDAKAVYDGDPAAVSCEEVILCYPGFCAIFVYRIAHSIYEENIPIIPRLMTEYAHIKTGIDIHPGVKIGTSFMIDHGTGIVIGETTEIGNNVRIYQGVTLGALSLNDARSKAGIKRHPTIGNNVIIYANATILGGETIISDGSIINGNTFITKSV